VRTIKAAVLYSVGAAQPYETSKPLKLESFELAPPGRDEVLVKIRAAGLCHSDLSVINGSRVRPTPMVLGHEAAGAVLNTAKIKAGSTVAVVGLGGVGLNSVLGARLAGGRQIVAIDLKDKKLALSKELGATDLIRADDPDCAATVRSISDGGVDYAFEMAGSTAALELAWAITRRGGQTITGGLPHPDARLSLPVMQRDKSFSSMTTDDLHE
jgi:Zn-dependent alcohol dehydrogenase